MTRQAAAEWIDPKTIIFKGLIRVENHS